MLQEEETHLERKRSFSQVIPFDANPDELKITMKGTANKVVLTVKLKQAIKLGEKKNRMSQTIEKHRRSRLKQDGEIR